MMSQKTWFFFEDKMDKNVPLQDVAAEAAKHGVELSKPHEELAVRTVVRRRRYNNVDDVQRALDEERVRRDNDFRLNPNAQILKFLQEQAHWFDHGICTGCDRVKPLDEMRLQDRPGRYTCRACTENPEGVARRAAERRARQRAHRNALRAAR